MDAICLTDEGVKAGVSTTFTQKTRANVETVKVGDIVNVKVAMTIGNSYDANLDLYMKITCFRKLNVRKISFYCMCELCNLLTKRCNLQLQKVPYFYTSCIYYPNIIGVNTLSATSREAKINAKKQL